MQLCPGFDGRFADSAGRHNLSHKKVLTRGHNYDTIIPRREMIAVPHIIPIRDLKKTSELSQMCKNSAEPIFITKNGYGDMVIMSMEMYEKLMLIHDVYSKLDEAEEQVRQGKTLDADEDLKKLREKYSV